MAKIRIPVMLLLFSAAAMLEAFRLSSLSALTNGDIWWHLSSGLWILQHHAVPRNGLFSQSSALPWFDSSWAYDLLLAVGFKLAGLRVIPILLMFFKTLLAVLTFLLAGGLRGRFWMAVALSAIAQYILGTIQPGPAYVSILFFGIELLLLLETRRTGSLRPLWWMPLLLLLWANLHVQFVYGVVLLLLFTVTTWAGRFASSSVDRALVFRKVTRIAALSLLATIVTPYLYGPYKVFFATTFSSANQYLPDFHALGFRQPQDYLLLLLAMAAFLALGLRRSRDLFQILLLAGCLALSFYAQRDIWLVTLAALAMIGEALRTPRRDEAALAADARRWTGEALIAVTASLAVVIAVAMIRIPGKREALLAKAGQSYPVAAADYIREHNLPKPLFNAYEWGGFLTWYLPEYPVAIDGRTDLYGEDTVAEYSKAMNAAVRYTDHPALAGAQTIVLPKNAIMAEALSSVPIYQVAYSDDVAIVLTRRSEHE
jgi:hypothetical protein